MAKANRGKSTEFLLLLLLGGIFALVGVALPAFGHLFRNEAAQIEGMPLLSRAELRNSPAGSPALVEGRLNPRNEATFQGFVAYRCEEFQGWDDPDAEDRKERWVEIEKVTPPLRLNLPDGEVRIVNDSYTLKSGQLDTESGPGQWQSRPDLAWDPEARVGTRRCYGYRPGVAVLALGRVGWGPDGPALSAEWIYGGRQADYVAGQRNAALVMTIVGLVFGVVGLGLVALAFRLRRRAAAPEKRGRRRR